ncbi:MAG: RNase adapter RapZ [Coriobacteriia bacterium]
MDDRRRDRDTTVAETERDLVIITGMSGAGRSEAIHTFEDLGYFCIDNLPPTFLPKLVEMTGLPGSRIMNVAVVCDVRGRAFFDEFADALDRLEDMEAPFRVLFLEADQRTLITRFKETRRRHPLGEAGSISAAVKAERDMLRPFRERADHIIDTSAYTPRELRATIRESFLHTPAEEALTVSVSSFGFKYGIPMDADIVMDVRFLPNPHYIPKLRPRSGLEKPVRQFVLEREETAAFLSHWLGMVEYLLPHYQREGKSHLHIALGCTGGMHRSVVLAETTASHLRDLGYPVNVTHRDLGKDKEAR